MIYMVLLVMSLAISYFPATGNVEAAVSQAANQNFITVEGTSLQSKVEAAKRLGRASARGGSYWIGYQFEVKPGVQIEHDYNRKKDGRGGAKTPVVESNNVGIFMLHEAGSDAVTRLELVNLDRPHDFSGYPVYWLGRAVSDESLSLMQSLIEAQPANKVADQATMAIALHNDSRVGQVLEGIVTQFKVESLRKTAVFWLGQTDGETGFLSSLISNEQENQEVRKQAAFAIGISKDAGALTALQNLYAQVKEIEVKKQILFAAFVNSNSDAAADFLIRVAGSDTDRDARKQAIFWLGQKAGQRTLEVLGNTVEQNDADTEVQKQAVFAISQRKKEESVPMLLKIAKTHPKPEVRKQAIFWLGQIDDERALELFKELLSK